MKEPSVGIFFVVGGEILTDAVPLSEGEPYCDAIQHGSHYEYWEMLQSKTQPERLFKARAYDAFPRGRVVYFGKTRSFRVYADKCLNNKRQIAAIAKRFGLAPDGVEVMGDEHYQCAGCNPFFMD